MEVLDTFLYEINCFINNEHTRTHINYHVASSLSRLDFSENFISVNIWSEIFAEFKLAIEFNDLYRE